MPRMSGDDFADGLYHLAREIGRRRGGGYDPGSGVPFKNNVFEMWSFWASSECYTCEDFEYEASEAVLRDHNTADGSFDESHQYPPLPENFESLLQTRLQGMSGYKEHLKECERREWLFHHYSSGLKVKWYKRIGRSTESNVQGSTEGWYRILLECLESLRGGKSDQETGA